jgi:hypothetical protein
MEMRIADESVQAWLRQIRGRTEIRSADGKLLGVFEPHLETEVELYQRMKKLFDSAEIERREAAEKDRGYTFEQVMEHLRSLETK